MKNLIYFILIVATFSGCTKNEQKLFVDEISGSYNIASITFSKADLITDSITLTNVGEFVFENCKIQNEKESRGFCNGYYIFNNEPKFNFGYKLNNIEENLMRLQANNSPDRLSEDLSLLGLYSFVENLDNKIVIKSETSAKTISKIFKVRITLERK